MEKSRKKSYAEKMAEDGSVFTMWTSRWGIKIYPWYEADKLKFSFIEKGTKGGGFDVYMDINRPGTSCFRKWEHDILSPSERFCRIMAQEAQTGEKYPRTYKFVTGNNGEKSVGICNSQNGKYCINGSALVGGKKVFANIPVDFGDLVMLAENVKEGYAPRFFRLEVIRNEVEKRAEKYFKTSREDEVSEMQSQSQPAEVSENPCNNIQLQVNVKALKESKDGLWLTADAGNGERTFFVSNETMNSRESLWKKFVETLGKKQVNAKFVVNPKNNGYEVLDFVM